jgi:trk system potassium uptake protein TrkA
MFVVIISGGRVGSHLATLLIELGHKVRLIENRQNVIEKLHRELPTEAIHTGDPFDSEVLQHAGIQDADVLVTAASDDSTNLAVAYLAKHAFHVPRVISRVNNPRYAWLFSQEMGVDVKLNTADILARMIQEEMSVGDMMMLLKLKRGKYALVEEKVPPDAPAVGVMIKDLDLPEHCVIAAIIRDGKIVVPRGVTAIEPDDEILAVVDSDAARRLEALLEPESTFTKENSSIKKEDAH